jgi:hypothetical protein
MEFLKKNYEKVLLGLVLLGLGVAVALLPFIISSKRTELDSARNELTNPKIKELPALEMAREDAAIQRAQTVIRLNLSGKHNLFNPVLWQKTPDGRLVKVQTGSEIAGGVEITAIQPLYLKLAFDSVSGKESYLIGVENQAAANKEKRNKTQTLCSPSNPKNSYFSLREVKGPSENPTALVLNLNDTGEVVTLGPGKPYQRVDGHSVDLKYPPENRTWRNYRVGANLAFAGSQYNIVAITETNIVLSASNNGKKTTINFNPSTEPR